MAERAQAATEYIAYIVFALIVALIAANLLAGIGGAQDVKVLQSRNYWKSANPLAVVDWSVKQSGPDANNNASVQMAFVVRNPTSKNMVVGKIIIAGMNFTETYSYGTNFAGAPDNISITLSPSEQNMIVLIQKSGPPLPKTYQMPLVLVFSGEMAGQTQNGTEYLRGMLENVPEAMSLNPPNTGCPLSTIPCNMSGTKVCCTIGNVCSMGTRCCPAGQVSCGGSCCQGSCSGGLCVPQGYFVCNGAPCQNGKNCCAGVCQNGACPLPDLVIGNLAANATSLTYGSNATIDISTKNIGQGNAGASYTAVSAFGGSGSPLVPTGIGVGALASREENMGQVTFVCNSSTAGLHTITAGADNGGAVQETDETNNANSSLVINCTGSISQITGCTVLSAPGRYVLANNLYGYNATSKICLQVASDNVWIDCNGHGLDGMTFYGGGIATGIWAGKPPVPAYNNISITGCTFVNYNYPVYLNVNASSVGNLASSSGTAFIAGSHLDINNISASGHDNEGNCGPEGLCNNAGACLYVYKSSVKQVSGTWDNAFASSPGCGLEILGAEGSSLGGIYGTSKYGSGIMANGINSSNLTTLQGVNQNSGASSARNGIKFMNLSGNSTIDGVTGQAAYGYGITVYGAVNSTMKNMVGSGIGAAGFIGVAIDGSSSFGVKNMIFQNVVGSSKNRGITLRLPTGTKFINVSGLGGVGNPGFNYTYGIGMNWTSNSGNSFNNSKANSTGKYDICKNSATGGLPGLSYNISKVYNSPTGADCVN